MQRFENTPLMAAAQYLGAPAVFTTHHAWSWADVHVASIALALRLEGASTVCNLCSSRLAFLVTWMACLRPVIVVDDERLLQPHWSAHATCMVNQPRLATKSMGHQGLAFAPDWDAPLIRLYTSGTTGVPEPQVKTLAELALGAQVLMTRLDAEVQGGLATLRQLVCSVPPQHMFGVETSVMLPLIAGTAVLDQRPLLPADVHAAFDDAPGEGAWVATPLHLSALTRAGQVLPHCGLVLVSTMPLAKDVAAETERLTDAPVMEIYGSTETGVVAMRRTATEEHWRVVGGVRLGSVPDGTQAWGLHFRSPRRLADQIEQQPAGTFRLVGRQADLIKIAGRRASLAGLNLLLQGLPGFTDGVFYLPATGSPTERLVLILAGAPLDRQVVLDWLRERMDHAFLPRVIIEVDRLPRTEAGKLPRAALDDFYAARSGALIGAGRGTDAGREAVTGTGAVTGAGVVTGTPANNETRFTFDFRVPGTHPALPGHFPGRPVVPGVLLLDHVLRALHHLTGRELAQLKQVKFSSPLMPDESAHGSCKVEGSRVSFQVNAARNGAISLLAEGSGILSPEHTF